uniref:Uncharacterized protein n=2 Tax=Thermococcus sp. AMT11 TaxID=563043 RepID=C8BND0_9EURY|nr:unknown [Thermococcus sp. AMT11]
MASSWPRSWQLSPRRSTPSSRRRASTTLSGSLKEFLARASSRSRPRPRKRSSRPSSKPCWRRRGSEMVQIRISWDFEEEQKDAEKVLKKIEKALSTSFVLSVSKPYKNREGTGGRIYVRLMKKKRARKKRERKK